MSTQGHSLSEGGKLLNLFLHVHASCTHCEKRLMIFLYTIKLFVKSGNTQHRKPIFGLFMKHNFKYSTKKIHIDPMGHETQISSKTQHELNFMLNFLPVHYPNKPAFRPLTSMLAPSLSLFAYLTCLP